jgi:hypothetical protein
MPPDRGGTATGAQGVRMPEGMGLDELALRILIAAQSAASLPVRRSPTRAPCRIDSADCLHSLARFSARETARPHRPTIMPSSCTGFESPANGP